MSKDPAFLFYSSDFLTGTMVMTDEEVGQYIRLLCLQHQTGHLDAKSMRKICNGNATASILAKFKEDENGNFFNERLDTEIIKRKEHSEKQRQNASMRWHKSGNAVALPLEDENVNENEIEKVNGNAKEKKVPKKFHSETVDILQRLIDGSGKPFKIDTVQHLQKIDKMRIKYGFQPCVDVVDIMCLKWKGDPKMDQFMRPSTLFAEDNFIKYMDAVEDAKINNLTAAQIKGKPQGNGIDHTNLKAEALMAGYKMFKK